MAASEDLINFDVIETQKENIQSLPGGRSARTLASVFSPAPLGKILTPTPSDTRNLNDTIRQDFEAEILSIAESDDPLDVYDRYVKWTLDAYPSAQATPQSQLVSLLERATKAFLTSSHYKNDPRYLKLWLHYIRLFSDSPRETFAFLARHNIGEGLALFYEEFAAWLEGANRWTQADEVYKLGIEREARPAERLMRKFSEFQHRYAQRPQNDQEPSSPALPTVRPALVAKVDPFAVNESPENPSAGETARGWESIGSLEHRKKENIMEARPWVGETLKTGTKQAAAPKMLIFKDESLPKSSDQDIMPPPSLLHQQQVVNPRTGKAERVFVKLDAVYPDARDPTVEMSFEELRAKQRGWLERDWSKERRARIGRRLDQSDGDRTSPIEEDETREVGRAGRVSRSKNLKVKEIKVETQTIKTNLASPTGPKIKRKTSAEPTMTFHTRAATDEIYGIFNQPLKSGLPQDEDSVSGPDSDDDDDCYTSAGESTGTGRISTTSELGECDETEIKSVSEWSDFTTRKHVPDVELDGDETNLQDETNVQDETEGFDVCVDDEPTEGTGLTGGALVTPTSPEPGAIMTKFIPVPPEDYEAPTQPFRDAAQCSMNRLPFMTPIVEKTESSLAPSTVFPEKDHFNLKTPSRGKEVGTPAIPEIEGEEMWSSPFQEIVNGAVTMQRPLPQPALTKKAKPEPQLAERKVPAASRSQGGKETQQKGPIIKDAQCNPVDDGIRSQILENLQPPLASYDGYFDRKTQSYGKGGEIRKFGKAVAKMSKNSGDRTSTNISTPPVLHFEGADRAYTVKRELGKGAFAPVYLVEGTSDETEAEDEEQAIMGKGKFGLSRQKLEALKMEDSPTPWEFYIMRQAKRRLGVSRAADSIIHAYEMHLFADECYLVEEYHDQGTLLDLVNIAKTDTSTAASGGVMDEQLAIFFTIELLRVVEGLHAKGIMHGDLKADNCLVRLAPTADAAWTPRYRRDGTGGWEHKGVALIDFGRGIDMRAFRPEVQFIADWPTGPADCAEMREMRPWTYQLDYHGLAGIVHSMLFGKYIETVAERGGALGSGATRTYRLAERLKRYWQAETLWEPLFALLLNPLQHAEEEEGGKMPLSRGLRRCREAMEAWLEANCERGVGLKAAVRRMEERVRERRR
ncbi:MAG: hypothetical protein M1832_001488 [Thelocarpon impressellum]|nr:MAG: hypothetical protein M1832_001488 [Thelocarpon impressellum]